jgi:hypothetical protein
LIPIIPPSLGHGYDIYTELGSDKCLIYARFDDSTKDFPLDTTFAQIGVIKNPTIVGSSSSIFTENTFSSLTGLKLTGVTNSTDAIPGTTIYQTISGVGTAIGYIASYDDETKVLKYFADRSLFYNKTYNNQIDSKSVGSESIKIEFSTAGGTITASNNFTASIQNFSGITTSVSPTKTVRLDSTFTNGISLPEINKTSGEIVYLDNRPLVTRNPRQKEDIKIVLEF